MVGKKVEQDKKMIVELRSKSQITLPKSIIRTLGLSEGDKFEVVVENGEIRFIPVAVYPKAVVERWGREFDQLRRDLDTSNAGAAGAKTRDELKSKSQKTKKEGKEEKVHKYKSLDEALADLDRTYDLKDVLDKDK